MDCIVVVSHIASGTAIFGDVHRDSSRQIVRLWRTILFYWNNFIESLCQPYPDWRGEGGRGV